MEFNVAEMFKSATMNFFNVKFVFLGISVYSPHRLLKSRICLDYELELYKKLQDVMKTPSQVCCLLLALWDFACSEFCGHVLSLVCFITGNGERFGLINRYSKEKGKGAE
jgi:hypothetical protein